MKNAEIVEQLTNIHMQNIEVSRVILEMKSAIDALFQENAMLIERICDLEEDNCDLQIRVTKLQKKAKP